MHPVEKATQNLRKLNNRLNPLAEAVAGSLVGSIGVEVELGAIATSWDESIKSFTTSEGKILPYVSFPFKKSQEMEISPVVVATAYMGIGVVLVVDGVRRFIKHFKSA